MKATVTGRVGSVTQFGPFELRSSSGELRKHGIRIRLQGKPLQLLQALIQHPGEVVTREDLRDLLWAADTFVDFESGLNTAVNRLRLALGDSAEHPRYIETVARSGYRFMAPISEAQWSPAPVPVPVPLEMPAPAPRPARNRIVAAIAAILLIAATLALLILRQNPVPQPSFHQLTFRRITVSAARFTPDGDSVIYGAHELPGDSELYMANTMSPESRPLGFQHADLAAVSRSGELALITYDPDRPGRRLVRVPLNGGAPLALDRAIKAADWSPDGSKMAVIRYGARAADLEYPRGKIIYHGVGWLSDVRVSPSSREIAFMEHFIRADDAGIVKIVDSSGVCRALTAGWASAEGLAWAPNGREVWFTAARTGVIRSLYAVDLSGTLRLVASFPGTLTLRDISRNGRVLISRDQMRMMMEGFVDGSAKPKDLSWFDYSHAVDISADGRIILFDETGEGGGAHHSVYIRRIGAPGPVRVGDGWGAALSPDGTWAITMSEGDQTTLNLVPLTPGQPRIVSGHGLRYDWVRFFPGGDKVLAGGSLGGGPMRLYVQSLDGGKPQPLNTSVYLMRPAISPDGAQIAGVDGEQRLVILPVAGGEPKVIASNFMPGVLRWESSGKSLLAQAGPMPASLVRVALETGRYKPWKEIAPSDPTGVGNVSSVLVSQDERTMVYSFVRDLSELFVVDGWR